MRNPTIFLIILAASFVQNLCNQNFAGEFTDQFTLVEVSAELRKEKVTKVFQRTLQMQINGKTLREFGYELERISGIHCWIDTRINPEQIVNLSTSFQSLRSILDSLCEKQHLKWVPCGRGIFLTDENTHRLLPMLVDWHKEQITIQRLSSTDKLEWQKRVELSWPMLSRPADLCQAIVDEYQFKLTGKEIIPHDLLAPGRIFELSRLEQLQTILVQYGLTWVWKTKSELEIIPIQKIGSLSLNYDINASKKQLYQDFLMDQRELKVNEQGKFWIVTGSPENQGLFHNFHLTQVTSHDRVDTMPGKLKDRKFTLKVANVKVLEILNFFKNNQVNILWDENISSVTGVNLNARVSIDLKDASLDEMLKQVLKPAGLTFNLQGEEIWIVPVESHQP